MSEYERISLQSIFDAAYHQFIVNDASPAWEKNEGKLNGSCRYLTSDGSKCAIGLKIPDGHEAQGKICTFAALVVKYPELWDYEILNTPARELDGFQQGLHDLIQSSGEWKCGLEARKQQYLEVAREFGLNVPEEVSNA